MSDIPGSDNHIHQPTPWTGNTGHTLQHMEACSCNWNYYEQPKGSKSYVDHHMALGTQMKSLAGDPAWLGSHICKQGTSGISFINSKMTLS